MEGKFGIFDDGNGNIIMRHYDAVLHPDAVEAPAPQHINADAMNLMVQRGGRVVFDRYDQSYPALRALLEAAAS